MIKPQFWILPLVGTIDVCLWIFALVYLIPVG